MPVDSEQVDSSEVDTLLIFPPLVASSFGNYYPSLAVLAAWLEEHGLRVGQYDLNARFAAYLITDAMVDRLGNGEIPDVPIDSLIAACARWVKRERGRLIAEDGTLLFGATTELHYVMEELAASFASDAEAEWLRSPLPERIAHPMDTHLDFLAWSAVEQTLTDSVSLVGISVPMGPQVVPALLLADRIRRWSPQVRIVLGGPALSLMDTADVEALLVNHPAVSAVVRFDGEHPLLSLARQAKDGGWDPTTVPGVSAITERGVCHRPPGPGPLLNTLPRPRYLRKTLRRLSVPTLSVAQARGCYWGKCDYCDFVELYDGSPPYRGRHPDVVVEEMRQLAEEHGVNRFTLITESIPPAFARKMSQLIVDEELSLRWDSFAMVDRRFDRELLELMTKAGCEFLVIGMETLITRVLKLVHKSADRNENLRFLRDAGASGMKLSINLIPDLPSTTYEEAMQALSDIADFVDCIDSVSVFPFEATKSSRVGQDPGQFGLIPMHDISGQGQAQYTLNHANYEDPAMTDAERVEIHQRYQAFARIVNKNSRLGTPAGQVRADQPARHDAIRLAVEDVDFLDLGERLMCTHIVGKERIGIPPAATRTLRPYLGGEPFSEAALATRMGERRAHTLIANLAAANLIAATGKA